MFGPFLLVCCFYYRTLIKFTAGSRAPSWTLHIPINSSLLVHAQLPRATTHGWFARALDTRKGACVSKGRIQMERTRMRVKKGRSRQ